MKASGIYQILNKVNGKRYIGSAVNLQNRWWCHRSGLRRNNHPNAHLQAAWNLYGGKAFVFAVLEYVPDLERLIEREQHYMDVLQPEYNLAPTAGSNLGLRLTEETKQKLSEAHMGKTLSEEHRLKIGKAQKGKVVSEETKRRMSEAKRGRTFSEEHRRHLSEALIGRSASDETRRRLREIRSVVSDEARRNMSEAQKRRRLREAANRAA